MDFIDYASFSIVSDSSCSPTMDNFSYETCTDLPCAASTFLPRTDAPFNSLDTQFDSSIALKPMHDFDLTTSATFADGTLSESSYDMSLYNHLDTSRSKFSIDSAAQATSDFGVSPLSNQSRTPSLCGDVPPEDSTLISPPHSPHPSLRSDSKDSAIKLEDSSLNPPRRKRGRPRLDRSTTSFSTSSVQSQRTQRLPHNQVERKYREGLNASLERLRKTIPAFSGEGDLGGLLSTPRPSKAMILEGAIEHIKAIEKERDEYRDEIRRLRHSVGGGWDANSNPSFLAEL